MSRAQEIRKKRLIERGEIIPKKKTEVDLAIEDKAKELFDWVLNMLEHPTPYNTADQVYLSRSYDSKIRVGYRYAVELTDKNFDGQVMERLTQMFEEEEGYKVELHGMYPDEHSDILIKIK